MATSTDSSFSKPAETDLAIHPLIRERWSPRAFADRSVSADDLKLLFEAARWAPSSSNLQPWRFIVAKKEDKEAFDKVLSVLVEFNQNWARNTPVLLLAVAKMTGADDRTPNRWAMHDVGLALSNLAIQATALGLHVHYMAGFSADKARQVFKFPAEYEATTAGVIGYLGDPNSLPDKLRERELARRTRKPLSEIVFDGVWGEPAFPPTSGSD
jgi:nitroreductase